jgi:NNP family nitrate/nitrite transporter-like MFS transporter
MSVRRSGFLSAGHLPTLLAALLYFDVSFMVWIMLGPLAPYLREAFGLTATEQGVMTAIPLLGGAAFRLVLGGLGDRIGRRRTGLIGLGITFVPLVIGATAVSTPLHLYLVGLLLGVAGASFAVALPLAGGHYPPAYQGLAMGIAGAGNSGTLLATWFAPRIAERFGWSAAFAVAIVPVALVALVFALAAKEPPAPRIRLTRAQFAGVLREADTAWLSFLYSLTFGGFVGFATFLTVFFHEQYAVSRVTAGGFATIVVVAGSLLRPVGGWLSDRIGGYRLLLCALAGFSITVAAVAAAPPVQVAILLLFVGMGLLGMGNGAIFQLVPQRFPRHLGLVTGIVGAAGGLGGFLLPTVLGVTKDLTGTYNTGLLLVAAVAAVGVAALLELGRRWSGEWHPDVVRDTGIFAYRKGAAPRLAAQDEA